MVEVIQSMMSLVENSKNFVNGISAEEGIHLVYISDYTNRTAWLRWILTKERVDKIFKLMDEDDNGELTKSEFLKGAREDNSVIEILSLYNRNDNCV